MESRISEEEGGGAAREPSQQRVGLKDGQAIHSDGGALGTWELSEVG